MRKRRHQPLTNLAGAALVGMLAGFGKNGPFAGKPLPAELEPDHEPTEAEKEEAKARIAEYRNAEYTRVSEKKAAAEAKRQRRRERNLRNMQHDDAPDRESAGAARESEQT